MIQQLKAVVRYLLAIVGYYGVYELSAGQSISSGTLWAVKANGGDVEITTVANAGHSLTITILESDVHYGNYNSVTVTGNSTGTALIYPLATEVTIL